jgi:hypothetical protein
MISLNLLQAKNVTRDLATDIPTAQKKLGTCIQEVLRFESTFQIITNADITLQVSDLFEEVYTLMQQIDVKLFSNLYGKIIQILM